MLAIAKRALVCGFVIALTIQSVSIHADVIGEFDRIDVPAVLLIDGNFVRTAMLIEIYAKTYAIDIETFRHKRNLSAPEVAFGQIIEAIRSGSEKEIIDHFSAPLTNTMGLSPVQWATLIRETCGGLSSVRVALQVRLPTGRIFIWESTNAGKSVTMSLYFREASVGKWVAQPINEGMPMEQMLKWSLQTSWVAKTISKQVETKFQFRIALTGSRMKSSDRSAAMLKFNGSLVQKPLRDISDAPLAPVSYYKNVLQLLKTKGFLSFSNSLTAESQKKINSWWDRLDLNSQNEWIDAISRDVYINFLLDASPIYIMFYSKGNGINWSNMGHVYLVKSSGDRKFRIANFSSTSYQDVLLKDAEIFGEVLMGNRNKDDKVRN